MRNGRPIDPLSSAALSAALDGDRGAATALLRALLPRVRNLVRYLLPGDQDVDDVTQEALVAVLRGLSGFRGDGRVEAWADRVVARSAFAWIRRRRLEQRRIAPDLDPTTASDPGGRPDDYLERRRFVGLLDRLPLEQRKALVLHHVLGMSVPELAAFVDAPEETVRSRLRLGRARLKLASCPALREEVG